MERDAKGKSDDNQKEENNNVDESMDRSILK